MSETAIKIIFIVGWVLVAVLIVTMVAMAIINENNISKITSGKVIDKYYSPPSISQTKHSVSYSSARYLITVKGDNGITGVYEVTPEKYNEVKINDWYYNVNEELK